MFSERDHYWMQRAIQLAEKATSQDEVPVGAILVADDQLIGEGYNCPITQHDPSAHAEMIALRMAANHIQNYRLVNTTLYVTLEPCVMCAGAMVHARIKRLIFGAFDPKAGAITSMTNLLDLPFLNHRITYEGGLLAAQCGGLLSNFFREKRT